MKNSHLSDFSLCITTVHHIWSTWSNRINDHKLISHYSIEPHTHRNKVLSIISLQHTSWLMSELRKNNLKIQLQLVVFSHFHPLLPSLIFPQFLSGFLFPSSASVSSFLAFPLAKHLRIWVSFFGRNGDGNGWFVLAWHSFSGAWGVFPWWTSPITEEFYTHDATNMWFYGGVLSLFLQVPNLLSFFSFFCSDSDIDEWDNWLVICWKIWILAVILINFMLNWMEKGFHVGCKCVWRI